MMQRRRWERCRKELAVVLDPDGERTAATTTDICEGGVGIRSRRAVDAGTRLRFAIPAIADGAMTGIVRWSTPVKGAAEFVVGVELDELSAAHRDALADRLAIWRAQVPDEDA